jgi:hypothetical protein
MVPQSEMPTENGERLISLKRDVPAGTSALAPSVGEKKRRAEARRNF